MPWDIILALVACVVACIFLNYTKIGTYTYAIGSDEFVAKNMGINVNKYKVLAFILSGAFLGVMAILTISYGSSMVAVTGMASMSRNFVPTMGCFFGLAFKKYGMPLPAIIIGEFVINIISSVSLLLGTDRNSGCYHRTCTAYYHYSDNKGYKGRDRQVMKGGRQQ